VPDASPRVPLSACNPTDDTALPSASEMNELGWSFRSRTAKVGSVRIFDEFAEVESSFNDRFAAVLEGMGCCCARAASGNCAFRAGAGDKTGGNNVAMPRR
jgi:hypothetical protein